MRPRRIGGMPRSQQTSHSVEPAELACAMSGIRRSATTLHLREQLQRALGFTARRTSGRVYALGGNAGTQHVPPQVGAKRFGVVDQARRAAQEVVCIHGSAISSRCRH
jgi:hypothetical protein